MLFALPEAERLRRVLLCGAGLALTGLLAWWPIGALEVFVGRASAPASSVIAPAAAWLASWTGTEAGGVEAEAPAVPALAELERAEGRPAAVPGLAWIEVPLLPETVPSGELVLAAGADAGLAAGQAVVFGRHWIGRVERVEDDRAHVRRWTAAHARTGIRLQGPGRDLRAIALGRGGGSPPVVQWIEPGTESEAGMDVVWRPRETDPPGLPAFHLGALEQVGDPSRGQSVWVVATALPVGSEGRVFVALAGEEGEPRVGARQWTLRDASLTLVADPVLGSSLVAVCQTGSAAAEVVMAGDRALGLVARQHGSLLWVRRLAPEEWPAGALWIGLDGLLAGGEDAAPAQTQLYTRGGGAFPRGLPLGRSASGPAPLSGKILRAVAAPRATEAGS